MNNFDSAASDFQEVVRMEPESINNQFLLAQALFKSEKFEEAAEHFREGKHVYISNNVTQ